MTIRSLAGQATSGQKREEGGNGRGFPTFWHPGKRGRPFSPNAESGIIRTAVSHQINHAAEADGGAAVEAGPGQQELGREVGLARAGVHVPVGSLRGEVRTYANDAEPGVAVAALAFGPLPDVPA